MDSHAAWNLIAGVLALYIGYFAEMKGFWWWVLALVILLGLSSF